MLLIWKARFLPAGVGTTILDKFSLPHSGDGVKFKSISDSSGVFTIINFIRID
jgi:hypothetical protein